MYDSREDLPVVRDMAYQRFIAIDANIGSSINDILAHISQLTRLLEKEDNKAAIVQLQNYGQALVFIITKTSPENLAFAALIHSINGKRVTDYSDENMKEILKDLSGHGLTVGIVKNFLTYVKKNWKRRTKFISGKSRTSKPSNDMTSSLSGRGHYYPASPRDN